jgi:hypothetical protein
MVVTGQMIYNRFFLDLFLVIIYRNVDNFNVDNKQSKHLDSIVTHKLFFLQSKTKRVFPKENGR